MDKVFLLLVVIMFMITALFVVSQPPSGAPQLDVVPALKGTPPDKPWFREAVLEAPGTVLVFFTAPWCGYCKEMEPQLKALVKQHPDALSMVTVDGKDEPELSDYYRADYVPYLMVFVDGKPVGTVQGTAPTKVLEQLLQPYLKSAPVKAT